MHRAISTIAAIAFFLAATASPPPAFAEDAKDVFDSLYGPKLKQVSATLDRADDVALAKEMVTTAKASGSTPGLQALLCDAAYDLGNRHPDGFAAAAEAMQVLADAQEAKRGEAREKLLLVLTKQSRAAKVEERDAASDALIDLLVTMGDEKAEKKQYSDAAADYRRAFITAQQRKSDAADAVKAKLEWVMGRDRAAKQIERLQAKLLEDANDFPSAEEIVRLYVVDLNDPASAVPFAARAMDDQQKRLVPIAAESPDVIGKEACLELAAWYKALGDGAASASKADMYERGRDYVKRFSELHTNADDLSGRKAQILAGQFDALLTKVERPTKVTASKSGDSVKTITNSIGMKLILVRPGEFVMGSPTTEFRRTDKETQHRVKLTKAVYMGMYEVTQAEYEKVMEQNPSIYKSNDKPVQRVNLADVEEFCAKLSQLDNHKYRLPTEAEWEYACRAGSKTAFSFGDDYRVMADYAWHRENAKMSGTPGPGDVGTKKPNAWGFFDMHGNVWEWVSDKYAPFTDEATKDPQGPPSGQYITRGGSWGDPSIGGFQRSAMRIVRRPDARQGDIGFRVVMEVK